MDVEAVIRRRVRERDAEWAEALDELQGHWEETKEEMRHWEHRAKEAERAWQRLERELTSIKKEQRIEGRRETEEWREAYAKRTRQLVGYVGEMASSNALLRKQLMSMGLAPVTSDIHQMDRIERQTKRHGIAVARSTPEAEMRRFFEKAYATATSTHTTSFDERIRKQEHGLQVTIAGIWQEINARQREDRSDGPYHNPCYPTQSCPEPTHEFMHYGDHEEAQSSLLGRWGQRVKRATGMHRS